MLCLSELGEIDRGLASKLNKTVTQWIKDLLADSDVGQIAVYTDAHYATIVRQEFLIVQEYKLISDFIDDQADRCFQHFRVRLPQDHTVITVINCHAPSSGKRNLTT